MNRPGIVTGVSKFLAEINKVISREGLIPNGDSVLVAVSGGVDSMALLRTLVLLGEEHSWKLAVAHFNHRLRGKSSDADQRFVEKAARELGIQCYRGGGDVKQIAS